MGSFGLYTKHEDPSFYVYNTYFVAGPVGRPISSPLDEDSLSESDAAKKRDILTEGNSPFLHFLQNMYFYTTYIASVKLH